MAHRVDAQVLVFHVDLLIVASVAVLALLSLPRLLARFSRRVEWNQGLFLWHSTQVYVRAEPVHASRVSADRQNRPSDLSDSGTLRSAGGVAADEKERSTSYPRHVPAWSTSLHPFAVILRYPIAPRVSLGQLLLMAAYFAVLLYAGLYHASPFQQPVRAAYVAMSQIPVVYVLATKNNVISVLIGIGYEKLNWFHQWAGTLLVLAANVHAIGYIYKFSQAHTWLEHYHHTYIKWGIVGLVSLDCLFLFSMSILRTRAYNVFYATHQIALILFLVAACLHQSIIIPYVAVAAGFYGLDLLFRFLKSRVVTATITPIPEFGITRIEIPQLNAGWRAGQHVRVRILSSKMGLWGWTEFHPLTIASTSHGSEGLVLLCKMTGGWSKKLYDLTRGGEEGESTAVVGKRVKVVLEGPYGGPGHCVFSSYSGALFIAGGSGITFPLASIQELLRRSSEGTSRVRFIQLIWVVQGPGSLSSLIPLLSSLLQHQTPVNLQISVYYTRATVLPPSKVDLPDGLTLTPCRPNLARILDDAVNATINMKSEGALKGMIVGVCGPVMLGQDVCRSLGHLNSSQRNAVGGVELHEEYVFLIVVFT
ncbi:hypothetical protein JAAARDRAFT_139501 [Jaapia argillacea MUCL 33604]|uniref:ferric-chelate reductase (NADPH) n=1 Tax=Jaapia argillacea MUCL 33604 TaxID=933084 RepID=A0A067PDJ0_9AGAM|nr:hypothetical protein JAAARDRAFT_139501 [Jaapia argillacea MUCL 33604]